MPDSYELEVVKSEYSYNRFYIYAKHITKKHPDGETILYNILLNDHLDVLDVRYLSRLPEIGKFEFKRGDWKFDEIDRRLNRIQKQQNYLINPPSLKCVCSVMKQHGEEFRALIYFLVGSCSDKKLVVR